MSDLPEDKISSQIWEILKDIKEEYLLTPKDSPVKYRIPNVVGVGVIWPERRIKIIRILEEKGAITIHKNQQGVRIGAGDTFYFYVNEAKFNEVYEEYNSENSTALVSIGDGKDEPLEVISADLESKFLDIMQEKNDNNFYLKIADYGRYLLAHPSLESLIFPLIEQSKKDVAPYKNSCDAFIEKWRILAKDLVEQAEKVGIKDDATDPSVNQINRIINNLNETPSYDDDYLNWYYGPYYELVERFKKEGEIDIIAPKHFFINKEKGIEILLFQSDYKKAGEEWDKFKKMRELQVWWAHYQIMRLAHGVLQLKDKDNYFHNDSLIDSIYLYDFNQVSQGGVTVLLRRNVFEEYITRLHKYLAPRIKAMESREIDPNQKTVPGGFLKYYYEDSIAEFKGITTKPLKGKAKALLNFLNESKGVPYSVEILGEKCNPNINNPKYYFRTNKDVWDCINGIKKKLKVKNSEYFPIEKVGNNWIWKQK